ESERHKPLQTNLLSCPFSELYLRNLSAKFCRFHLPLSFHLQFRKSKQQLQIWSNFPNSPLSVHRYLTWPLG
ncbi:unnamed protein product, partial [Arabidopsis halleri]